ncbi:hypothetical protein F5Y17DRAFT_468800 [Xylariaceae sp. FL0594]|nr:hypothetical protein F5Y17DRAFT_468800 [Xylariaceae sp. FL0594]
MFPRQHLFLVGVLLVIISQLQVGLTGHLHLHIPHTVPLDASPEISPDFPGLAFEQASFVRYAQDIDKSNNEFSANLISAHLFAHGRETLSSEPALPVAEADNYQDVGHTTIGPSFWTIARDFFQFLSQYLPTTSEGALFVIQVPLVTTNISETGKLSNASYVGNWTRYVSAIRDAIPSLEHGRNQRLFTAFDVSTHYGVDMAAESYVFDVATCFGLGIDRDRVVKEVAHHYYQRPAGTAQTLGEELILSASCSNEVGNSLQPTHTYEFQARLESALWIHYQQIMHAGYDLWLPVASAGMPAQVFANYYSQPFVADFIVPTNINNIAAYAAYESGTPRRIAVINMNYWNHTSSSSSVSPRGSVLLDIHLPPPSSSKTTPGRNNNTTRASANMNTNVVVIVVYHLNSALGAGATADSITYAGSQWTYASRGREVKGVVRGDTEELRG